MRSLVLGEKRQEFCEALVKGHSAVGEERWREAEARPVPEEHWELVAKVVRDATLQVFSPTASASAQQAVAHREERAALLRRRKALRMRMAELFELPEDLRDEAASVQLGLALERRRARLLRKEQARRFRDGLVEEVWASWRARRFHALHRAAARLSSRHYAKKQRVYGVAAMSRPSAEEWLEYLSKSPSAGGMKVREVTLDDIERQYWVEQELGQGDAFERQEVQHLAAEDLAAMTSSMLRREKRKFFGHGSAPLEAFAMLMAPSYRFSGGRAGVGYDLRLPDVRAVQVQFLRLLEQVRRRATTPLAWHRSTAFPIPKATQKLGCPGMRIIHCFDPVSTVFFAAQRRLRRGRQPHHRSVGGVQRRSRNEAYITQAALCWRADDLKRSNCVVLFDASNAFCCTKRERLEEFAR